jgi:hypothetical protein
MACFERREVGGDTVELLRADTGITIAKRMAAMQVICMAAIVLVKLAFRTSRTG